MNETIEVKAVMREEHDFSPFYNTELRSFKDNWKQLQSMQHRFDMDGGKRKLTELIVESNELNDSEEPKKKITPI